MSNILIIQAARFGDLLQTKRLILTLASRGTVHLAVDSGLASLAELIYPGVTIHALPFHGQLDEERLHGLKHLLGTWQELDFKYVYNCNFSHLTAAITRIFEPERVRGYRPAHDSKGGLTRSSWARLGFRLASLRPAAPLNLVDYWGWFTDNPIGPDMVNPPAIPGGKGIGVAIAGREERRSVPLEGLAAACHTAFRYYRKPPIFLFGTENENSRARKLTRLFDGSMLSATTNLCGKTHWAELIGRLAGLDLLITPDTGLMHLAAHLGVPTLSIFLSSAWLHETGPYGLGHILFQAAPPCAPCLESRPCDQNLRCQRVFLRTDFSRCVNEALDRILPLPWPDGLELWQSGLDDLGANPTLLRGHDKMQATRTDIRNIVKGQLGLATDCPLPNATLLNRLEPNSEWMLPPWRYC